MKPELRWGPEPGAKGVGWFLLLMRRRRRKFELPGLGDYPESEENK